MPSPGNSAFLGYLMGFWTVNLSKSRSENDETQHLSGEGGCGHCECRAESVVACGFIVCAVKHPPPEAGLGARRGIHVVLPHVDEEKRKLVEQLRGDKYGSAGPRRGQSCSSPAVRSGDYPMLNLP